MLTPHSVLSVFLLVLATLTAWAQHGGVSSKEVDGPQHTPAFRAFRDNYVLIYSTAMGELLMDDLIPIHVGQASGMAIANRPGLTADSYGACRSGHQRGQTCNYKKQADS